MKKYLIAILAVATLFSCQSPKTNSIDNSDVTFFDMKGFFEGEIKHFSSQKIKKTVMLNDKVETKTLDEFDVEKELALFVKASINKPAWKDKFEVVQTSDKETYTAVDEDLNVRKVEIEKTSDNQVKKIRVETAANSPVFEAEKVMIYEPKVGFTIQNKQDVTLVGNNTMSVEVLFL